MTKWHPWPIYFGATLYIHQKLQLRKPNGSQATLQTLLARDRFAAKSSAAVEVQVLSDGCWRMTWGTLLGIKESNAATRNQGFERDKHRTCMMVYDDCVCVYDMCDYRRVHLWTYCWIILSDLKWPHLQKQPVTVIFHDYCVFLCWNHDFAKIYLEHEWTQLWVSKLLCIGTR